MGNNSKTVGLFSGSFLEQIYSGGLYRRILIVSLWGVSLFPSTITSSSSSIFVDREIQTSPLTVTLPPIKEINNIHITARKLGIKSLYYQHSMNAAQKFKQKKDCASCEGWLIKCHTTYTFWADIIL